MNSYMEQIGSNHDLRIKQLSHNVCLCCSGPEFESNLWPFAVCHPPLSHPVSPLSAVLSIKP